MWGGPTDERSGENMRKRRAIKQLSARRTDDYFRVRAARGDVAKAKRILKWAGRGKPPVPGDGIE